MYSAQMSVPAYQCGKGSHLMCPSVIQSVGRMVPVKHKYSIAF